MKNFKKISHNILLITFFLAFYHITVIIRNNYVQTPHAAWKK